MGALISPSACLGITSPALSSYPTRGIGGHRMVRIPGGRTIIGTSSLRDEYISYPWPHWIQLAPYFIGETTVSESQYSYEMGQRYSRRGRGRPLLCLL